MNERAFLRRVLRLGRTAGIQLLITFLVLEVAARVFDPLGVSYYPETARYFDTLVLEEPIGYRNRPGLRGRFHGAPVEINSLGLRDREIGEKVPGETRILVMGDSVPFGMGVSYEDSFPAILEELLRKRHPGRTFRTVNMGVPSYNTEQELIQLQSLGFGLKPDAAVLLFSANDIEPKLWVLDKRRNWYVNLAQRSYAASLLYIMIRDIHERMNAHAAEPERLAVPSNSRVAFDQYRADSPRWQAIDRSLTEMNAELKKRGMFFVLFTQNELEFVRDMLDAVAQREKFAIVHLDPGSDPRWASAAAQGLLVSIKTGHPSPLGNRAIATLMAEFLEAQDFVRRPLAPPAKSPATHR